MIKPVTFQGVSNFKANLYALEVKSRFIDQSKANGYYKNYGSELQAVIVGETIQIGTGAFVVQGRMSEIVTTETVYPNLLDNNVGYICARCETYHPSDEYNTTLVPYTAQTFDEIVLTQEDIYQHEADNTNKVYELPIFSFEIADGKIVNLTKLIEPCGDYEKLKAIADKALETAQNAVSTAQNAVSTANQANQNSSNAVNSANQANQTANQAVNRANQAKASADAANNTADSAKGLAEEAMQSVTEGLGTKVMVGGKIQSTFNADEKINKDGDTMTGLLNAFGGIALNSNTQEQTDELQYMLGIDSASGGRVKWKRANDVKVGSATGAMELHGEEYGGANVSSKIKCINVPSYTAIEPTHTTSTYLQKLLIWICYAYPNHQEYIFTGLCEPNSRGNFSIFIYNTDEKNSSGLPRYSVGQYFPLGSSSFDLFGTSEYDWKYTILSRDADTAQRATADGNGNNIVKTYLKKIGDKYLQLYGETVDYRGWDSTNPKILFGNAENGQKVAFVYNDYDNQRAPAGITLAGEQGNEYFEAPRLFQGNYQALDIRDSWKLVTKQSIESWDFGFDGLDFNTHDYRVEFDFAKVDSGSIEGIKAFLTENGTTLENQHTRWTQIRAGAPRTSSGTTGGNVQLNAYSVTEVNSIWIMDGKTGSQNYFGYIELSKDYNTQAVVNFITYCCMPEYKYCNLTHGAGAVYDLPTSEVSSSVMSGTFIDCDGIKFFTYCNVKGKISLYARRR